MLINRCMLGSPQGPRSEALPEMNGGMEKNQLWLRKTKRKAFYAAVACEDFREGAETLLQVSVNRTFPKHFFKREEEKKGEKNDRQIHLINV